MQQKEMSKPSFFNEIIKWLQFNYKNLKREDKALIYSFEAGDIHDLSTSVLKQLTPNLFNESLTSEIDYEYLPTVLVDSFYFQCFYSDQLLEIGAPNFQYFTNIILELLSSPSCYFIPSLFQSSSSDVDSSPSPTHSSSSYSGAEQEQKELLFKYEQPASNIIKITSGRHVYLYQVTSPTNRIDLEFILCELNRIHSFASLCPAYGKSSNIDEIDSEICQENNRKEISQNSKISQEISSNPLPKPANIQQNEKEEEITVQTEKAKEKEKAKRERERERHSKSLTGSLDATEPIRTAEGKEEGKECGVGAETVEKERMENLENLLLKQDIEFSFDNFDLMSYTHLFLLCLLINPRDASPNHFHIALNFNVQSNKPIFTFKSLENHLPFGTNDKNDKEIVRNILYLFPQMNENIPVEFIYFFLCFSPEIMLIETLIKLQNQNDYYSKLHKKNIISEDDFYKSTRKLSLNISIPRGLIKSLYNRILAIQSYFREQLGIPASEILTTQNFQMKSMRKDSGISFHTLLCFIEPGVGQFYQNLREKYPKNRIIEAYREIYQVTIDPNSRLNFNDFLAVSRYIFQSSYANNVDKPSVTCCISTSASELLDIITMKNIGNDVLRSFFTRMKNLACFNPTDIVFSVIIRGNMTEDLLKCLLEQGAEVGKSSSYNGYNTLHAAASKNGKSIIPILIKAGANVNELDDANETPLDKAIKYAEPETLDTLHSCGAKPTPKFSMLFQTYLETKVLERGPSQPFRSLIL